MRTNSKQLTQLKFCSYSVRLEMFVIKFVYDSFNNKSIINITFHQTGTLGSFAALSSLSLVLFPNYYSLIIINYKINIYSLILYFIVNIYRHTFQVLKIQIRVCFIISYSMRFFLLKKMASPTSVAGKYGTTVYNIFTVRQCDRLATTL